MRALYPDGAGSYHCDGCGESGAALGFEAMHHCAEGCAYALCSPCAAAERKIRSGEQPGTDHYGGASKNVP